MEFLQSQSYNKNNKNSKKRLTQAQVRLLERSFSYSKKLEPKHKLQLADELGIPPRQVAVWYQNKRARWRTQSLELDCSTMQLRLDAALTEKRQLEREVDRLRRELEKAKEALEHKKSSTTTVPPISTVCSVYSWDQEEEAGSSSLCDVNYNRDDNNVTDDQVLRFDHDLFSCLIKESDYERGLFSD